MLYTNLASRLDLSQIKKFFLYALIGSFGAVLNTLVFLTLTINHGINYLVSSAIATEIAIISNFVGNDIFTFRGSGREKSQWKKFSSFQLVSLATIFGTMLILWILVSAFGTDTIALWNLIAIAFMFAVNFTLNCLFTWGTFNKNFMPGKLKGFFLAIRKDGKKASLLIAAAMLFSVASPFASAADSVAVSHLGYHPLSAKQVVVYTNSGGGSFEIINSATGQEAATFQLQKPKDFFGGSVQCQGNMPCLVGDFSSFGQEGTFQIKTSGLASRPFIISKAIYSDAAPVLLDFFNAQRQQNSDYHADMHSGYTPQLLAISDGSFIMESHQAAAALIRLGSAYRRNPSLFQSNGMKEHILNYAKYLQGLQGISVNRGDLENAVRLGYGMKNIRAFVPGPTGIESLDVYIPGSPPVFLEKVNVESLCGNDDGSAEWDKCIADAALYYKCQIDEPCLDIEYNDDKGTISNGNGFAVSRGWNYEFGCFFDVNLNENLFNGVPNPCLVFFPQTSREFTEQTLLAFLEAYPAVSDLSPSEGQALLQRAFDTYNFLKTNLKFDEPLSSDYDAGFWGTSLFLLYDYSNKDPKYLQEAYSAKSAVSPQFISDKTRGNEFYWEEYIRHRAAIQNAGLQYGNPEELFRGKMFNDYKDSGSNSISSTGERIFQFDHNIQFQNSRYILTEGLLAAKTTELHPNAETWIPAVADMQLAWLTGMNNVQQGVSLGSPTKSMSFIFGIGDFPKQFHSRYLVDTGYKAASQGSVIGARGTNLQFLDKTDNQYYYLDGRSSILGYTLGALGNERKNEAKIEPYKIGKSFKNGKSYISGWINGPFDTNANDETDIIFNYHDDLNTYQFTESTDEIVATAVELISYLDAQKNRKASHDGKIIDLGDLPGIPGIPGLNTTLGNNSNSTAGQDGNGTLTVHSNQAGASVFINLSSKGVTDTSGEFSIVLEPGSYDLKLTKQGYSMYSTEFLLDSGQILVLNITMQSADQSGQNSSGSNVSETNISQEAKITGSSTSLAPVSGSGNTTTYYMREDSSAIFRVNLNSTGTVVWLVNGVEANRSTGKNLTFSWNPGILFVPREPDFSNIYSAVVTAQTLLAPDQKKEWNVNVENVINPFFSAPDGSSDVLGSQDTRIRVFTNDGIFDFTGINVTIRSGSGEATYQLLNSFQANNETDWSLVLTNVDEGNIYISKITGFDERTKKTLAYELGSERAHYRTVSQSSRPVKIEKEEEPEEKQSGAPALVYVTFDKDVIGINDTQTISLDAKNFNGGISGAEAFLIGPDGQKRQIRLKLVRGSREYGTWSADFTGFIAGPHTLQSVVLESRGRPTEFGVVDRNFYVVDGAVGANEVLMLVYSVLSHSTVKNGTNVTFRIDARDFAGIKSASARVKTSRVEEFSMPLTLVKGSENYGTWQGTFTASKPDTTYIVMQVTLSNGQQSKTYEISDRSVYVLSVPSQNVIGAKLYPKIFSREWFESMIRKPLVPTLVGFGLMFLVIGTIMMTPRAGKPMRKYEASKAAEMKLE